MLYLALKHGVKTCLARYTGGSHYKKGDGWMDGERAGERAEEGAEERAGGGEREKVRQGERWGHDGTRARERGMAGGEVSEKRERRRRKEDRKARTTRCARESGLSHRRASEK
eukprot:3847002-Pleurochrysis_carterae.AAC.1